MGWENGGESSCRGVNLVSEGQRDFYKVLGVNYDATDDSIRSNYLRLALKWHPDKHLGEDGATLKFQEINEAYRVLSDPVKRLEYDMKGDFVQEYSIIEYLNRFKGLILTCNGLGISNQNKWAPHTLRVDHANAYGACTSSVSLNNSLLPWPSESWVKNAYHLNKKELVYYSSRIKCRKHTSRKPIYVNPQNLILELKETKSATRHLQTEGRGAYANGVTKCDCQASESVKIFDAEVLASNFNVGAHEDVKSRPGKDGRLGTQARRHWV